MKERSVYANPNPKEEPVPVEPEILPSVDDVVGLLAQAANMARAGGHDVIAHEVGIIIARAKEDDDLIAVRGTVHDVEEISVRVSGPIREKLAMLVVTGFYGQTPEDASERIIARVIDDMDAHGRFTR